MREQLQTALAAIRSNRLRTTLTICIIALGITSLVGIQSAIAILSGELSGSFGRMGTSALEIVPSNEGSNVSPAPDISLGEGLDFIRVIGGGWGTVSLEVPIASTATVSAGGRRTDPVVTVSASDAAWLVTGRRDLAEGRNFSERETTTGAPVCIIGSNIARKLSVKPGDAVSFSGTQYMVIGLTRSTGMLFGGSDNNLTIPIAYASGRIADDRAPCRITLLPFNGQETTALTEAARSAMRTVRRTAPGLPEDFTIRGSDSLLEKFSSLESKLSLGAMVIGLITILGAAVALMNILLVSVRERTGEIGLRKALGQKRESVKRQFLLEALLICQTGGIAGILLGIAAGGIVAALLGSTLRIPWEWVGAAEVICLGVSLLAGTLPASRAARLSPVAALRQ